MANAVLEDAKTGRSKCATTGVEISQGSPRVGFEIWRMGRRCMTYQTPRAFLNGLQIGVADNSRSKCKFSGKAIATGDPVILLTVGGAKGEKPTSQLCNLGALSSFIGNVTSSCGDKFHVQKSGGFKTLPRDVQAKVIKLFAAKGASAQNAKKRPASGPIGATGKRAKA